jgi:tetratricopeptide (TPR) repeat protein
MRIVRRKGIVLASALVLIGLGAALAFVLAGSRTAPAAPPLAVEQLRAATEQRTVNKTDDLIWSYQERVRQNPDDTGAYAVLGTAYVQRARETGDPTFYGKAEAVFAEALKRDPQRIDSLIGQGILLLARHQFREALALGEQARALNPTIPRIYGLIADAQIELGMYPEAVATLQTMVDMRPDLNSYSRVAYARELHGDLEGAIEAMTAAVESGGPTAENTEWVRVQLGHLYFATGDLERAELQYQEALARYPGYVHALGGLGRIHAALGQYDAASARYQEAIARMPLPEFVIALGEVQEAAGRPAEAAKQYELVRAMQQLFQANGVDTDLELALFDADHPLDRSDPAAAAERARAAYARRPSIKAADTLAWSLFRAGQLTEARQYAQEALRLGTKDSLMLYHAGMIAQAQGDSAAARDYLGRALALNPRFSPLYGPLAQRTLDQLNAAASR